MIPFAMRAALLLLASLLAAGEAAPPSADGWCGAETQLVLEQPGPLAPVVVQGMVPALGDGAFRPALDLLVDGQRVAHAELDPGAFEVRAVVSGPIGPRRLALVFSQTRPLPAPDGRMVAARLDRIALERLGAGGNAWARPGAAGAPDIVAEGGPAGLGAGWYTYETFQGSSFRWMGGEAELCLRTDAELHLAIDAEAGPAIAGGGDLRITDRTGRLIDKVRLGKRGIYDVLVPPLAAEAQPIRLRLDGSPQPTPGDRRTLGVRVFAIAVHQ